MESFAPVRLGGDVEDWSINIVLLFPEQRLLQPPLPVFILQKLRQVLSRRLGQRWLLLVRRDTHMSFQRATGASLNS